MITLFLLGALYFLPTIVASQRELRAGGIGVLNVFFGWTGIGWLALLVSTPDYVYPAGWSYGPARRW